METQNAAAVFTVLSSEARLAIFRLLVRAAPQGLVAGEIARKLDIPKTNLSFHLKNLVQGDMTTMEREGRHIRYRANIALMLETISYLTENCCSGNPDICQRFREESGISQEIFQQNIIRRPGEEHD
ncbi:MAG: helix-turn-helix domain-containing protein [Desulfobulbaceae bacterium]|nr:helix-turn-helix domain-containing protein [Desulfobulbaceae bacterium]